MDFAVSLSYLQATYIGLVIAMSLKNSYLHFSQDLGAQQLLEKTSSNNIRICSAASLWIS